MIWFVLAISLTITVSILAQVDNNQRNTVKCKQMLKEKSYQPKFTGEHEMIRGVLFCRDERGNIYKLKP